MPWARARSATTTEAPTWHSATARSRSRSPETETSRSARSPAPPSGAAASTRIAGIRGVTTGVANAIPVLIDSDGQLGTASSSRSVKKDIRDMGDTTARLLELRPVTFRYREQQPTLPDGSDAPPEYGLVAEEVAEVFPDLVVYDEAGKPFTVKYHELAPMLPNEMKRQQREHALEMAALTAGLAQLEVQMGRSPETVRQVRLATVECLSAW